MEKENEEIPSPIQPVNSPNSIESFLEKNWKFLSLFVTVGLMVFAVLYFYKANREDKAIERGKEFVSATMEDSSISSLLEFAEKNKGTVSGDNAKLIIAEKYISGDSQDLEKAQKSLEEFISNTNESNDFFYDAMFSLATLLEKSEKKEEAKEMFEKIAANNSNSQTAAKIRLADLMVQSQQFENAIESYIDAGKSSNYVNQIETTKVPDAKEAKERSLSPPPPLEPDDPEPTPEPTPEPKSP